MLLLANNNLKHWTKFVCLPACRFLLPDMHVLYKWASMYLNCLSSRPNCTCMLRTRTIRYAIIWPLLQHFGKCSTKAVTNTRHQCRAENNMEHKMQMWFSVCKSNNLFCILAICVYSFTAKLFLLNTCILASVCVCVGYLLQSQNSISIV